MEGYLRAEISASAIQHNVRAVRTLLPRGTRVCPVVKANAYGHGLRHIVSVLGQCADMLGVATAAEAVEVRQYGWQRPLLTFATAAASAAGNLADLVAQDVTLTVTSTDELALLAEITRKVDRPAEIHVKIDTGMGRSGVLPDQARALVEKVRASGWVRMTGMYTHLACAEEKDKSSALEQLRHFDRTVDACGGRDGLTLHAANSAATIDIAQSRYDMVRPGLAIYGCQPGDDMMTLLPLRPALRLWAPVVQVKHVPAGAATGYGLTYRFAEPARLALVPVGYADGYFRSLSNLASMRVRGVDCPVRGRVSMDQAVIEVTRVPDVRIGDAAEIISADPKAPHSLENLARLSQTIPYELVTRLGDRITRTIVD